MRWFEWVLFIIAFVYIGNVLGCMILCETIPQIETMRRYAWMVPVLNLMLFFSYLFEALGGQGFARFWKFIKVPQKNIFILDVLAQSVKEAVVEERQYRRLLGKSESQEKRTAAFKGIIRSVAVATMRII